MTCILRTIFFSVTIGRTFLISCRSYALIPHVPFMLSTLPIIKTETHKSAYLLWYYALMSPFNFQLVISSSGVSQPYMYPLDIYGSPKSPLIYKYDIIYIIIFPLPMGRKLWRPPLCDLTLLHGMDQNTMWLGVCFHLCLGIFLTPVNIVGIGVIIPFFDFKYILFCYRWYCTTKVHWKASTYW